jgi:hypothetical protein
MGEEIIGITNNREFKKYLQEIAHGSGQENAERPSVPKPAHEHAVRRGRETASYAIGTIRLANCATKSKEASQLELNFSVALTVFPTEVPVPLSVPRLGLATTVVAGIFRCTGTLESLCTDTNSVNAIRKSDCAISATDGNCTPCLEPLRAQ